LQLENDRLGRYDQNGLCIGLSAFAVTVAHIAVELNAKISKFERNSPLGKKGSR
jgi:hypothetical protein